MAAWEAGWYYLAAGASNTYWVSWGDAWQGLQYVMAEPRGSGQSRLHVTAYGIQSIPRFGASPRISYWVDVTNYGPSGTNFVLRGQKVD